MTRRLISSGSTFEAEIGFSRALVDGDWVFVSGTTGFDYATMRICDDLIEQTEQCSERCLSANRESRLHSAAACALRFAAFASANALIDESTLHGAACEGERRSKVLACVLESPRAKLELAERRGVERITG